MPDPATAADASTHGQPDDSSSERDGRIVPLPTVPLPAVSSRVLWAAGIAVLLGDLLTTVYGLEIGLRERNPFVVSVLTGYGVAGLVALKLVALGWVGAIWRWLGRRYGIAAMVGLILPQSVAVALNVVTILRV